MKTIYINSEDLSEEQEEYLDALITNYIREHEDTVPQLITYHIQIEYAEKPSK